MKLFCTVVNETIHCPGVFQEYQTWFSSWKQTLKKHYSNTSGVEDVWIEPITGNTWKVPTPCLKLFSQVYHRNQLVYQWSPPTPWNTWLTRVRKTNNDPTWHAVSVSLQGRKHTLVKLRKGPSVVLKPSLPVRTVTINKTDFQVFQQPYPLCALRFPTPALCFQHRSVQAVLTLILPVVFAGFASFTYLVELLRKTNKRSERARTCWSQSSVWNDCLARLPWSSAPEIQLLLTTDTAA